MALNTRGAKFINCPRSTSLKDIAVQAAESRKYDDAITRDVESVEIKTEYLRGKPQTVLEVNLYSKYAECNSFVFRQTLVA